MFLWAKVLGCMVLVAGCWALSSDAQQLATKEAQKAEAKQLAANTKAIDHSVKIADKSPRLHLSPVETISSKSEFATSFSDLNCDSDGNLYLGPLRPGSTAVRKLNSKGDLIALFEPTSADSNIPVMGAAHYSLTPDGDLYLMVSSQNDSKWSILVFRADGTYKSSITLQLDFILAPSTFAVFPNGNLLVTGQEYDIDVNAPMLPFNGIFRSDGKLLKEIALDDDKHIHDMATIRDPQVMSPLVPASNRAVAWGKVQAAGDGNIYVMRWLSPAIVYAVAPSGEIERRFTIDAGGTGWTPVDMHISGNRIALLFRKMDEKLMKVVDLEGHELATYDEQRVDGKPKLGPLGLAYACYNSKNEQFTFLTTDDSYKVQMKHVQPR